MQKCFVISKSHASSDKGFKCHSHNCTSGCFIQVVHTSLNRQLTNKNVHRPLLSAPSLFSSKDIKMDLQLQHFISLLCLCLHSDSSGTFKPVSILHIYFETDQWIHTFLYKTTLMKRPCSFL